MSRLHKKNEQKTPRYLDEFFYCKPRRRSLTLDQCMNDYVTANALGRKRSACWLCPQGKRNRCAFAEADKA